MIAVPVILLCGAQASGKSTYAQTLQRELGLNVHSRDEVRLRLRSCNPLATENEIWRTLLDEAAEDVRAAQGIVLDSTLANPVRRNEAVAFFKEMTDGVVIHRIHASLADCFWRNAQRHPGVRVEPSDIPRTHRMIEDSFKSNPPQCPVVDI